MSQLNELTAKELLVKLHTKQCTVQEIVQDCLKQTSKLEKDIQAWAYVDESQVVATAATLDMRLNTNDKSNRPNGNLFGIPIGVKDVFNTKEMPTQMGSPIWKDFQPGNDARVVHYLKMEDAVIFGKTVTAEFAVHAPGPTKNPHNLNHTPGTSSSGSAAAVASFMIPMGLGTQTAGSIIRPSSYCGVYGFKPSFGLIPRTGVLKTTDSLDTIGGIARSIEDIQLLFDCIRVKGRDFPISENALNDTARQNKPLDRAWKVAIVKGPKWSDAESYAQTALSQYANHLSKTREIEVSELSLPPQFDEAHKIHSTIYDRTLAYYFQREYDKHTLVSPNIYEIISRGKEITLDQYKSALAKQDELYELFDQITSNQYDIVLSLSTGGEALEGLDSVDRPDNCLIWTLCGAPALNLPLFRGPKNLPFGAQIVARRYNDYLLLNFAKFLQERNLAGEVAYPQPTVSMLNCVQTQTGPTIS